MKLITNCEIHQFDEKGFLIKKNFLTNFIFKIYQKKLIYLSLMINQKKLINILE